MTHIPRWAFTLVLLPVAACSNAPTTVASVAPVGPPPLAQVDQSFIGEAASSDAGEVQSSQLAQQKARSPRIKAFAAKMVQDHTQTTQQLSSIAQAKGMTVSPAPSPAVQDLQAKLQGEAPPAFDRDYIRGQLMAHKQAEQVYQTEIDSGQDPDLKAFAQQTLPIIQQHYTLAQRLAGRS